MCLLWTGFRCRKSWRCVQVSFEKFRDTFKFPWYFSIGIALSGITSGTLLGLFTMGMVSDKFNTKGALWGSFVSIVVVSVIAFGAQIHIFEKNLLYETLPFNIEQCDAKTIDGVIRCVESYDIFVRNYTKYCSTSSLANSTVYIQNAGVDNSSVHWIFRINYMYYSLIGTILVAVVGYPISIMSGGTKNLDPKLLSPIFRRFYNLNLEKSHIELKFISTPEEKEKLKNHE